MKMVIKRLLNYHPYLILKNDAISEPHLLFEELLEDLSGVSIFSGTINGFFW